MFSEHNNPKCTITEMFCGQWILVVSHHIKNMTLEDKKQFIGLKMTNICHNLS